MVRRSVTPLGRIARLQVQRSGVKLAAKPGAAHPQYYDPAALVVVPRLRLTASGAEGLLDRGQTVLDVHHLEHPSSRNARGQNDVSVGFTAHYGLMRDRFGPHLEDGIAGENILVEADRPVELSALAAGLMVETADGTCVLLQDVLVAEPCVPFTRFCLRLGVTDRDTAHVKDCLQFLRKGMRGFYANYAGTSSVVLGLGDRVLLRG